MKTTVLAIALLAIATTATAQSTSNRSPFSGFIVNPCSGEPIVYTGECHTVTQATGVIMNCHGTGTGALGNEYVFSNNSRLNTQGMGCPASTQYSERARFITSRVTQNFFLTMSYLVTTDANCIPTIIISDAEADCRGRSGVF
jgi:hypothetical protein